VDGTQPPDSSRPWSEWLERHSPTQMTGANLHHPDIHRPWSDWSEAQTLHMVVVYNNPFRWRTRRELVNDCIRHLRHTPNVQTYVVELAYGRRPFEVTGENPLDIQLRTDVEMWHKENLINLGVSRFPPEALYGGYTDGDFHFTRHDWALEAIHMLQHHHFVQLFSAYSDLTAETATSYTGHRPYRIKSSFAWNYLHQKEFLERKKAEQKIRETTDPYYGLKIPAPVGKWPFGFAPGAPGGAWAWNMDAFTSVGGMLSTCILGSGDWHMAFGLADIPSARLETQYTGRAYNESIRAWQKRASKLKFHPGKSAIGCVDNYATHFFHGSHNRRGYGDRWQILVRHDFNPVTDIAPDWQGVWRWTGDKPVLRDEVRRYFIERFEDDPSLTENTLA